MKLKIYIAGPMSGKEDFNRAAFNAAAKALAAKGWQPINPVDVERLMPCEGEDGKVDAVSLQRLMFVEREIVRNVDAICLLDGWEESKGAREELNVFLLTRDLPIYLGAAAAPHVGEGALDRWLAERR